MTRSVEGISSAEMKAFGFIWDPTWQGYERWTHLQLCITCLRQPYMTDQQWETAKREAVTQAHKSDDLVSENTGKQA